MRRSIAQGVLVGAFFCLLRTQAVAQSKDAAKDIQNFAELLKHYQLYPEYISILEKNDKDMIDQFKKHDAAMLKALPPATFKNLYQRYYPDYVGFKEVKGKIQQNIKSLEEKKVALPLSEKKEIVDIDLKLQASGDRLKQAKFVLFDLSLKANKALMDAYKSPSVLKAMSGTSASAASTADASKNGKVPKLPGSPQGSKADRVNATEAEKLNLTPVDPEFYNTQLGKKLEKDLGGRADYWSYDFDQDELYVVVGSDVGKLRVKQKDQATRIIQTRMGSGFQDFPANYAGDTAVDLNLAKGRFLTGNPADTTLFGPFPTPVDNSIPEGQIDHPVKNRGGGKAHPK